MTAQNPAELQAYLQQFPLYRFIARQIKQSVISREFISWQS
jgi:hypothetical protein